VLERDQVIGFIGIGLMGEPIVGRLLAAGFEVIVWNRTPAHCEMVLDAGAEVAETIPELIERADIVMLCLADAAAVEEIVFGEDGIASCGVDDQLLVDLSSVEPEATRRFARELDQACGMAWVDAPVSGNVAAAQDGTLIVMAGGHEEDIERARPVFDCFARRVTRVGPVGTGQVAKACNQVMVGCTVLALSEMIALAERSGVDAERIPEALGGGFGDSPLLQLFGPRMAVRQFDPVSSRIGTLIKDMDIVLAMARDSDAALPLSALVAQLLRQHTIATPRDEDWSTLIELYSE